MYISRTLVLAVLVCVPASVFGQQPAGSARHATSGDSPSYGTIACTGTSMRSLNPMADCLQKFGALAQRSTRPLRHVSQTPQ